MPDVFQILIWVAALGMAALLVYAFFLRRRRRRLEGPATGSPGARQARSRFATGVLCMVVFGPLCLLTLWLIGNEEEPSGGMWWAVLAFFLFFYIVGAWYVLNTGRRRAEVGERLRYTPLVGPARSYAWDEVAYAPVTPTLIRGYDVNHVRLFRVDASVLGFTRLSSALTGLGVPQKHTEPGGAVLRGRLLALVGRGRRRDTAPDDPRFRRQPPERKLDNDVGARAAPAFGSADVKIFLPGQQVPVYEMIRASVDEKGELPPDFRLPGSHPATRSFAPGARDGMQLYHFPAVEQEEKERRTDELMGLVADACTTGDTAGLVAFLYSYPFVLLADTMIDRLRGGWREVPPGQRFFSARHWVETSGDPELVKLGIALLNGVNLERDEDCRQMLATLALCDEYTLYAQVACSLWDDVNDTVFEFARRTHGWGKIFMVSRLDPLTEEICDWIARSGCENRVLDAYLGPVCASKINMPYYLRQAPMDAELFRGLGTIIAACLVKDGPLVEPGIKAMGDQAVDILLAWLEHAVEYGDSLRALATVLAIRDWNMEEEAPDGRIEAACEKLLAGRDWAARALGAVEAEMGGPGEQTEELFFACRAAEALDIPLYEPLFALLESDPIRYCGFAPHFFKEADWGMRVIELYETELPLGDIASGMGDEAGLGPGYEAHRCLGFILQGLALVPLTGIPLVEAGLGSPVTGNRGAAIGVLEMWNAQLGQSLEQFSPELMALAGEVCDQEVVAELKKRLEALLEG